MIIRALGLLLALALTCVPALLAAAPITLQYKFAPKELLKYKLVMTTDATFKTPDGGVRNNKMENYMELQQELIEKKDDGTYRIAVTINKAEQKVDGKPAQLQVAIGQSILMTMKPSGHVLEGAADLPAAGGQSALQMVFPEQPVEEKQTWDQVAKISQPIPMEMTTKYIVDSLETTLPSYDGKVVAIKSTMGMENTKTPTGEGVNSKTDGKIWFDAEKGRIVQSKAQSTFNISIPVNLQGILPPNSKVMIDFKIDIDISLMK